MSGAQPYTGWCKCGHHEDDHDQPDVGGPYYQCFECNCGEFADGPVPLKARTPLRHENEGKE